MHGNVLVGVAGLTALIAVVTSATSVQADGKTGANIEQLRNNDDYRVRTQAALALGASGDDLAVPPLCDAVGRDGNVAVKVAAAAALGKLGKPAALPCLTAASDKESVPAVKAQIARALATLREAAAATAQPPLPRPDSKFYVALDVTNKTARKTEEVTPMVRATMQSRLLGAKGFAVAPTGETAAQGGTIVRKKKLKGFFLIAVVDAPLYDGSALTQVVRVSAWTYPGKALIGDFSQRLTQSDTPTVDPASEVALMKQCTDGAIGAFLQRVSQM